MEKFLSIVLIIYGILQIILFFKIWNMTSDVANILKIMKSNENKNIDIDKIKYLASKGKGTQAEGPLGDMTDKLCADIAQKRISKKDALERYADLEKKYKELGKEIPEYLNVLIEELFKSWNIE